MKKSSKRRVFLCTNTPRQVMTDNWYELHRFSEFRAGTAPQQMRARVEDGDNSRHWMPVDESAKLRTTKCKGSQIDKETVGEIRPASIETKTMLFLEEIEAVRPPSRKKLPPGSQTRHYKKRNSLGDIQYERLDIAQSADDIPQTMQNRTHSKKPIPLFVNSRVKRIASRETTKTVNTAARVQTTKNTRPHKKGILNTTLEPEFLKLFSRRR